MAHVIDCVPAVSNVLKAVESTSSPHQCEFELRLGKFVSGTFVPGVDASFVGSLLCNLETSDCWTEITDWTQIIDKFYLLPSGLEVRTSSQVVFMEETSEDKKIVPTTPPIIIDDDDASETDEIGPEELTNISYEICHVIKTSLAHVDLKWDGSADLYGMRVGVKQEAPVFEDELQECVEDLNIVRIKQRRSFRYTPKGCDRVQWSIDVTQVWQEASYTSALEALRRGETPKYEVEIECLDCYEYLNATDAKRLSLSMLMKGADLFGFNSSSSCKLIPV